jgi:hypothetical protein
MMLAAAVADGLADEKGRSALTPYDIPAQALDSALGAYIRTSGAQVLYENSLTVGRLSGAVNGSFTPEAALGSLLSGTGLIGRRADVDAFIITVAPQDQSGPPLAPVARDNRFAGALQSGVLGALCNNPQTRPGDYRIALELWLSPAGVVQRVAFIGSTGDAARDVALVRALQGVVISAPMPAGTPQPLVLTVAPRPASETGDCAVQ